MSAPGGLISVEEARRRLVEAVRAPVDPESLPLGSCAGRTLAEAVLARRTQPPFAASAMDGYAVRQADVGALPARLRVIGTAVAGRRFEGEIGPGEAVRIFTGAPVPAGADTIVIQEATSAHEDMVEIREASPAGRFLRGAGLDFREGDALLSAGERLDARRLALAAAGGHPRLSVRRRPRVAILATGDELERPGDPLGPDQIVASNLYATAALVERAGGEAHDLGIARDNLPALAERIEAARALGADLLVTLGGASVGEHDLVREALTRAGMELGFWRIAMRPGKPLIQGRLGEMLFLGLPGNPVSSIVCGLLFLVPGIRALLGDPHALDDPSRPAVLGMAMPENDGRQDYVRARIEVRPEGLPLVRPFSRQDSSMLRILAEADALVVRAPRAPAAAAGDPCRVILLDDPS